MRAQELIIDNDQDHRRELERTGFWGRAAAGSIIFAKSTNRFCLAHRSSRVKEPNTWGIWGGAMDLNEDPKKTAYRELYEETGYLGEVNLQYLWTFKHHSGFTYTNFVAIIDEEFIPKLNWETQDFIWVEFGNWPTPLHPGVSIMLNRADVQEKLVNLLV